MNFLSKLERRLGWMAIPHVTIIIVIGQACVYLFMMARPVNPGDPSASLLYQMVLVPDAVLHGEIWRLVSFIFIPPSDNILFIAFDLYFFYFVGKALEANWGTFRYNIYLLIGYVMAVAAAFVTPDLPATDLYMGGSIFLAFAFLFPELVILLFLVLPIKVKWMGWAVWALYLYQFVFGGVQARLLIIASVLNFLIFFGSDIIHQIRTGHRRLKKQAEKVQQRDKPFHVCAACGITDKTHPKMEFRYCPLCAGQWGYCSEHLLHHEHKTTSPGE